jgi:enamine deaminase RidA (YjgF/YER057c/UK114 family)
MPRCCPTVTPIVHSLPRAGCREYYLTATPPAGSGEDGAAACFAGLAAALAEHRAEVVAEKVYGTTAACDRILGARRAALVAHGRDPGTPVHYLDGRPCDGGEFGGVQVWAVGNDARRNAVESVPGGRLWHAPYGRALHLCGMRGTAGTPFAEQAGGMFSNAAVAAARSGFRYAQTARTWIYLANLLDDYAELNRVRSTFYRQCDFVWPASTGIQAAAPGVLASMDVLLLDGIRTRRIDRTLRQGPASDYGSAFSRAMLLEHQGGATLHVSGTASIDGRGKSRHDGDASAQYLETMLDVAAVLREADLGLADIVQATLFCKNREVYAACRQVHELLSLPQFPVVYVLADVCRPELLVELEAVACR